MAINLQQEQHVYKVMIQHNQQLYYLRSFAVTYTQTKKQRELVWTKRRSQALQIGSQQQVEHIKENILGKHQHSARVVKEKCDD